MSRSIDFSRIREAVDIPAMQRSTVAFIGVGGSADLIVDLVRSGLAKGVLVDPQSIDHSNVARQGHAATSIGRSKVASVEQMLKEINPAVEVICLQEDFTKMTDSDIRRIFAGVDLLVLGTDSFAAQARGNVVALMLGIPAVWIGLYARGVAGELLFWHPGLVSCFRCFCSRRYEAHAEAARAGRSLDPPSTGATILDIHHLDSIAGMIIVGLLTRGADNRFGRLIDELGDRQFLQTIISPEYRWQGRDIVREQLQIPADCDTYFAWNTIARRDPDAGMPPCPDCVAYRGR